jgi:hypothetical protein
MQIYKITNLINNKIYIGKDTTSDPNYFGSGLLINRADGIISGESFDKSLFVQINRNNYFTIVNFILSFSLESTMTLIIYVFLVCTV